MRLRELAAARVRFGYRRLTVLLRRDGWRVNAKRIYRLYTAEGLTVRTKHRTKAAGRARVPQPGATAPNQRWSMDFMSERVADGRWFRILTVVDQFTRRTHRAAAWCSALDHRRQRTIGGKQARRADRSPLRRRNGHAARVGTHSQWSSTWCEALLTIVIQGPRSGLDRTPHSRQPQWKLRALSTRSVLASTAHANGVLHWEGVPQNTADNRFPS